MTTLPDFDDLLGRVTSTRTALALDATADEWPDPIPLGDAHAVPAFPVEVLTAPIAAHVRAVAAEIQVAEDLPAMLALAALSICTTGHYKVHVKNGWYESLNLYLTVALPPGAGKSPAVRQMFRPIEDAELDGRADAEVRKAHIDQKRRMAESNMAKAEKAGDMTEAQRWLDELHGDDLRPVVVPRFIADDATPEALAGLLAEQHGRMALVSTEGGPFEMMTGRYSERANLEVYLQAWSGDTIRIDRVGRGTTIIPEPLLTVCLTVQPHVITALASRPELAGKGLTARIMYAVPADFVGYRDLQGDAEIDPGIRRAYDAFMARLVRHGRPAEAQTIPMADDARREYLGWLQGLEERRTPLGDLRPMAEWTTKLQSSVARVAGLFAIADDAAERIDLATMRRAIAVGCYWLEHAKMVHDMWGASEEIAAARNVLVWAQQHKLTTFSVRDVYAALRKSFPTAADTVPALNLLTERGWLRPLFDGPLTTGARGKPSPEFAVHPSNLWISDAHARHARHAREAYLTNFSLSQSERLRIRHAAHDAHDAHERSSRPNGLDAVDLTQSGDPVLSEQTSSDADLGAPPPHPPITSPFD